jgi:hypothetical protein
MSQKIVYEMLVTLTGEQLREVVKMRGQVLVEPIRVQGVIVHEGGTLVLLGFAGNIGDDKLCHGHYRFRRVQPSDEEREQFVLSDLPAAREVCHGTS